MLFPGLRLGLRVGSRSVVDCLASVVDASARSLVARFIKGEIIDFNVDSASRALLVGLLVSLGSYSPFLRFAL